MRKIIVFNMVTVDGYFAGEDGNIDWHIVDDEFNQFAIEQTRSFGTLIFGRVTYDLMAGYWPTPEAIKSDPEVAELLNNTPKIVFSRTLKKVEETPVWKNIQLYKEIDLEEIKKLKEGEGKDIAVFGSGTIVQQLTNMGMIDEYRLMVNPVILGKGKPMFENIDDKKNLKLLKTREFKSGNILLYYASNI